MSVSTASVKLPSINEMFPEHLMQTPHRSVSQTKVPPRTIAHKFSMPSSSSANLSAHLNQDSLYASSAYRRSPPVPYPHLQQHSQPPRSTAVDVGRPPSSHTYVPHNPNTNVTVNARPSHPSHFQHARSQPNVKEIGSRSSSVPVPYGGGMYTASASPRNAHHSLPLATDMKQPQPQPRTHNSPSTLNFNPTPASKFLGNNTSSPSIQSSPLPTSSSTSFRVSHPHPHPHREATLTHSDDETNREGSTDPDDQSNDDNGLLIGDTTSKRHICSTCGKRFNRPSSLKIHQNTHTGATPFRCPFPLCGRKFNVNSNMRRHYSHHVNNGDTCPAPSTPATNLSSPSLALDPQNPGPVELKPSPPSSSASSELIFPEKEGKRIRRRARTSPTHRSGGTEEKTDRDRDPSLRRGRSATFVDYPYPTLSPKMTQQFHPMSPVSMSSSVGEEEEEEDEDAMQVGRRRSSKS